VLNHSLNQLILQKYKTKNRLHKKSQPNKLGFYKFYFSLNSTANFNLSILASIFLISACKSRILLSLFAKSLFALSVSFKSFAVFLASLAVCSASEEEKLSVFLSAFLFKPSTLYPLF
jgi:hypothetical protein